MHASGKNISNKGFSLVELSIVIVIVGIMLAAALKMGSASMNSAKITDTERKLAVIQSALQLYYETNGKLPCPAKSDDALTDATFGVEDCVTPTISGGGVLGGVVPSRTLNVPDSYMFDGWGNRISYFIHDGSNTTGLWTDTPLTPGAYCTTDLKINDAAGNQVSSTPIYVLISHGKDGEGAYNRGGTRKANVGGKAQSTNAAATNNISATDTYVDAPINDGNVTANYFDDIVRWQTDDMMYYCKNNEC
jgi:prepilin-type N-terminal cleavage/methylation domain-containing protein